MACLTVKHLLSVNILIYILQILHAQGGHQLKLTCGFVDYVLACQSFNESIALTQKLCFDLCLHHANCTSTNYFLETRLCALNNVTHLDSSFKLLAEPRSFYAFSQLLPGCASSPEPQVDENTEQDLSLVGLLSEQSSTYSVNSAMRANDGHDSTAMGTPPYCSHTGGDVKPWWRVDLGSEHWLSRVTVLNRGTLGKRLTGARVRAGLNSNIANNKVCGSAVTSDQATNGALIEFVCDPCTLARYLSVNIPTNAAAFLQLCEVRAKEYVQPMCSRE